MNGAINQARESTTNGRKENPLLTQIVEKVTAQVPANLKDQFERIMIAGSKMMWSDEMSDDRQQFDQAIQENGNVPQVVTHTVLKICSIVQNESGVKKPLDAMGAAAPIFMSHILQYVESKLGIPVTKPIIDETGQMLQVNLLRMYKVSDEMMQELFKAKGGQQAGQPAGEQVPPEGDEGAAEEMGEEAPAGETGEETDGEMVPVNTEEDEEEE